MREMVVLLQGLLLGIGMAAPNAVGGRFDLKDRVFLRFALSGVPFLLAAALVRKNQTQDRCDLGFAFEQLPVMLEKTLVTFIRQSELAGRLPGREGA